MRRLFLPALLTLTACGLAQQVQLTPRDAFWSASDLVGNVTANPAAHKAPRHTPRSAPHLAAPAAGPGPAAAPAETASAQPAHVSAETVSAEGYGAQPHFAEASLHQLGLRYSLLLRGDDDAFHEVSPTAVFHSGDHLRLSVMANQPGYLYVIAQGSSGAWSPLFPARTAAAGANHIEPGRAYPVPGEGHAFRFDQNPGSENLYILLSRQPIPDLETTIDHLREGQGQGQPAAAPGAQATPGGQMLVAENRIPDDIVQHLVGRDLTMVDEQQVNQPATADATGEKAVYVVAKSGMGMGAQVVAHLVLKHE